MESIENRALLWDVQNLQPFGNLRIVDLQGYFLACTLCVKFRDMAAHVVPHKKNMRSGGFKKIGRG